MKKLTIRLACVLLASSTLSFAQERVHLLCLGDIHNPDHRYLNGNTNNGKVDLVANREPSGAQWEKVRLPGDEVAFKCLGSNHNPKYVFLNGLTGDGGVNLAPDTKEPYSGTHWKEEHLRDNVVVFKCMGDIKNQKYVYLNGLTVTGGVNLAGDVKESNASGTHWEQQGH